MERHFFSNAPSDTSNPICVKYLEADQAMNSIQKSQHLHFFCANFKRMERPFFSGAPSDTSNPICVKYL
jgi:hypothetical protein